MLSVIIICQKSSEVGETRRSVLRLNPDFLIDQDSNNGRNLGQRKNALVKKARGEWVLILDTDERVSTDLLLEIKRVIKKNKKDIHGYRIPYQNHIFGKPVYFGGEQYSKVRLLRKKFGRVNPVALHEEIEITGKIGELKGKILHYSYRTPWQVFKKFTNYAYLAAKEKHGESVSIKKLFLYGPHMVWARLIKEQGYKDGWRGLFLALAFGYMEILTYWILLFLS